MMDDNKKISMDDMDTVAGGSVFETYDDIEELWKRGYFATPNNKLLERVEEILHALGYTKCQMNHSKWVDNVYADKNGKIMTREEFWKEFDDEFI